MGGDLPHQRQAEPPAAACLAASRRTVERLEHALGLAGAEPGAVVADAELDRAVDLADSSTLTGGAPWRARSASGCAPDEDEQRGRPRRWSIAADLDPVAGRLLRDNARRSTVSAARALAAVVETAGQQDLLDQSVELAEVAHDLGSARRADCPSAHRSAMRSRASGERSSWLALASSARLAVTSARSVRPPG